MATEKCFLLLQGPHGPFFAQLAAMLTAAGATVRRVGFNGGDRAFWSDAARYIPYRGTLADWPLRLAGLIDEHGVTDIVLYGDTRPLHAAACEVARARGLRVHVFEEGYLRPWWVTYERGGSNGHSRLTDLTLAEMRAALTPGDTPLAEAPARWGDMREHVLYGALYHGCVLAGRRAYPAYAPHRGLSVLAEFRLYLRRLLLMPLHRAERWFATRRVLGGGFPYHLVLLQLEHDASFRAHGPFASMTDFVALCIEAFAKGAPGHHHLVFKAHPLEDGRMPLAEDIRRLARAAGLEGRVHFLRGGKLARLLDAARSAVTVNSTAAQQALWRGLPTRSFGAAVYAKPGLVSDQPLAAFFAAPEPPDAAAYRDFRRFLLTTSQISGGFYSARGRRRLLRRITDLMLADHDPYEALTRPAGAVPLRLAV